MTSCLYRINWSSRSSKPSASIGGGHDHIGRRFLQTCRHLLRLPAKHLPYETSSETLKSNRIDLALFESYVRSREAETIDGPAVIDFQYHLKNQRGNCGASINRKIFTLRSYGNFFRLYDLPASQYLPFYDVLKIRQGYRSRPQALTPQQIRVLFGKIDGGNVLGIRDYAAYALMYQLGFRVGEVHALNLESLDTRVIQSILGLASTRSTEPYIHPSEESIRQAFDRLPGVIYVKELISNGLLNLTLQKPYRSNRE